MLNDKNPHSMEIRDPVCGMEITNPNEAEKIEYRWETYYFCTTLCKIQFEQEPQKYINKDDDKHTGHHH